MKIGVIWFTFHWSFLHKFPMTISQHWFKWWLGAEQVTSHYWNQWSLVHDEVKKPVYQTNKFHIRSLDLQCISSIDIMSLWIFNFHTINYLPLQWYPIIIPLLWLYGRTKTLQFNDGFNVPVTWWRFGEGHSSSGVYMDKGHLDDRDRSAYLDHYNFCFGQMTCRKQSPGYN